MTRDRWQYAEDLVPVAADLVTAVRDDDPVRVHRELDALAAGGHLPALAVVLAAMVPDDRPLSELLAWTEDVGCDPALDGSPPGTASEHGSRSRYTAGCRGAACLAEDRRYRRERYQATGRRPAERRAS